MVVPIGYNLVVDAKRQLDSFIISMTILVETVSDVCTSSLDMDMSLAPPACSLSEL